jgi:predicted dinucleotide-binding enzyme
MLICGEDADAKDTVAEIARSVGFGVLDAGGIELALVYASCRRKESPTV